MLFPNLEAEQARNGHTNAFVAAKIGMSRQLYEKKKKTGNFKIAEGMYLAAIYEVTFEYLFKTEGILFDKSIENPPRSAAV